MSVTEFPCCVLCLVKNEDEDNSIFCKSDNNKKLFRKFLNFVKCRLKVGEFNFSCPSSSSEETFASTIPTLCERCSEVASNICDLHEELRSIETRMFRKLDEMEEILSLEKVTESTILNKRELQEVERFRELLTRQVRSYFDVERSTNSKEDDVHSDSPGATEIKTEPEASSRLAVTDEPENEDKDDDDGDSTNFDDPNFIAEDEDFSTFSYSSDSCSMDEFEDYEDEFIEEEIKQELDLNEEEEDPLKMDIEIRTDNEAVEPRSTDTNQSQGKRSRKSTVIPKQAFDEFSLSEVKVPQPPIPSSSSSKNKHKKVHRPEPPQIKRPKLTIGDPESTEETERDWSSRPCGICKESFATAADLRHHVYEHEVRASGLRYKVQNSKHKREPSFHCPFCRKVYYLEETLKVHIETERYVHESRYFSDLRFRCDGENGENECCTETYGTFPDLVHHLKTRHPDATIHHCGKCKWPFLNESARDLHQLFHITGVRKGGMKNLYQCPIPNCLKFSCHLSAITCHFSTAHGTGLRPYRCPEPECLFRGYSIPQINRHLDRGHQKTTLNDKPVEVVCDNSSVKSFKPLRKLRAHQKRCRKTRMCDICGEKFLNSEELANHKLQAHQVEPPRFVCDQCGKVCLTEGGRKLHLRSHEKRDAKPKEFLCPHCGKGFQHDKNLERHIAIIHVKETTGQERKRDRVCQDCGNTYFNEDALKKHRIMTHLSEEEQRKRQDRFRCPLCQKGFLLLDYLKCHIRTVHKVDPNETLNTSKGKRLEVDK